MRSHLTSPRLVVLAIALAAVLVLLVVPAVGAKALKSGTVEGTVLDQAGRPVAGVTVTPYAWTAYGADWWGWEAVQGASAATVKSGSYKLSLPAGRYHILFVPANLHTHAVEAYPNMPAADFGDDVIVRWGAATRRISAILDPAAHIEGLARDAANGSPVEGVHVNCIFQGGARLQTQPVDATPSDTSGHFEVWGMKPYAGFTLAPWDPTDTYWGPDYQSTDDFSFPPAYPAGVRYDEIRVERLDTVNLDGYVMLGDPNNPHGDPTPISGAEVILHEMWDDGGWDDEPNDPMRTTTTNDDGYFSFSGLQLAGRSVLVSVTEVYPDYLGVWYSGDGAGWGAPDGDNATPVDIQLGHTASLGTIVTGPCELTPPWEWD